MADAAVRQAQGVHKGKVVSVQGVSKAQFVSVRVC